MFSGRPSSSGDGALAPSRAEAGGAEEGERERGRDAERQRLESFLPRKPLYSFEELVLPPTVRRELSALKSHIANHSLLYDTWELGKIDPQGRHLAFNLYGLPGTGKTMCVEAMASELGKDIIDVSYAEIESKYVGETGKNIAAVFRAATESGALLFFDEADSILGRRMTHVTQAADHGVNVARAVMLKELDSFEGIVAFATNLSRNFDNAFVRRISKHIEIPLPDGEGRRALWEKMISSRVPGREELDWEGLALATEGFSGGDIRNVVVNSLARVADLDEGSRHATTTIFLEEVSSVAKAKLNVGDSQSLRVSEMRLSPESLEMKELRS